MFVQWLQLQYSYESNVAKVRSCSTRTALSSLTELASSHFKYRLHFVQQSTTNPVRQNDALRSELHDPVSWPLQPLRWRI